MDGLASHNQQDQSLLHVDQQVAGVISDNHPSGSSGTSPHSDSSLSEPSPHLGQNSSLNNDPGIPSVVLALPDQQAQQTSTQTMIGLTPLAEETSAGSATNPDQHVDSIGLLDDISVKDEGESLLENANGQIELLEGSPDVSIGSGDSSLIVEESQEWVPDPDHELKRVKVYELIGQRWVDQGTAFCFGQFSEERNEALLIARSERNYNHIILSTTIRTNDVYQRQQDTLIVWTEPDGIDYALSFQDPEGCAEVWNFILEVQQHLSTSDDQTNVSSSPLLGPETSVTTTSIIRSGHLPAPELGIISEIERAIKQLARTQPVKERICEYIQHEEYIKSLIEVMHTAEDLESLENLHALCSLMQTLLMLNDHTMYEHILEDDIFFGVVGILEYDPDFPAHKANYRDFLHNTAQFHQPIVMRDVTIQRKIHHTYRLQFLKDVVLARALDDSTFNVLNSCIIFNQIDIITHLQQDPTFLRDIVRLFVDEEMLTGGNARRLNPQAQPFQPQAQQQLQNPQHIVISLNGSGDESKLDTTPMDVDQQKSGSMSTKLSNGTPVPAILNGSSRNARSGTYAFAPPDNLTEEEINVRREVIMLLQQLAIMGKNVQLPARLTLFRTLVDRGILFAVQWALDLSEREEENKQLISMAGEVLSAMLDHDLNGVRGHVMKQDFAILKEREAGKKGADKAETILEMVCRIMAQSKDLSVQSQMGDGLKSWLEIPTGEPPANAGGTEAVGPKPLLARKDDPNTERFMDYFYRHCIDMLLKPLTNLPEWKNFKEPIYSLSREETNRLVYLCDLLYNFIQQHQLRGHVHVTTSDILSRIATLFRARDKHLRHAAFRIFRLLLKQNNPNSHKIIKKHDIMKPILVLTIQESLRDNLLSCSCQEYFEIMRKDNIKDLIEECMTKHETDIQHLATTPLGGELFQRFILRHEMNMAPRPQEPMSKQLENERWTGPERAFDRDEEAYFNGDEDGEVVQSFSQPIRPRLSDTAILLLTNNTGLKRKRRPGVGAATKGYRPPLKAPPQLRLGSLVDYDEDEEEESTSSLPQSEAPPSLTVTSTVPSDPSTASPTPKSPTISASSGPPPKRSSNNDDDEDNLLEALARHHRNNRSRPQTPAPTGITTKLGEKRRREEEEEEEQLFRHLVKPSKKLDLGNQKEALSVKRKIGDEPPAAKKIKVKLGTIGLSVASSLNPDPTTINFARSPASTSPPGIKDGDTG